MKFEELERRDVRHIQQLTKNQRGNIPVFIHPFYNVTTAPQPTHSLFYPAIRAELIRYVAENKTGQPSQYIQALPAPVFDVPASPRVARLIEASHQQYYQQLMRFFAGTTLPLICLFDEESNSWVSESIIQDAGYRGEILTVSTYEDDPTPSMGYSFTDITLFFAQIAASRLVIAGQNSWLTATSQSIDAPTPYIIEPLRRRGYNPMRGCVGAALEFICDEIERLEHKEPAVKNISLQFSKFVWPQRRSSDVSTLVG